MSNQRLETLLHRLASGSDEEREAILPEVGRFGPTAIESLAQMLHSADVDARWWAARALAEVGGSNAFAPLIGALSDLDPDVRACAALALGRIGNGAGYSVRADPDEVQGAATALAVRLADESAFVAGIAADALSMLGELAVGSLAQMLADDSAHARLLAVRALGRLQARSAIAPLFGALEDPSYLVRYYAQEALHALGVGMIYLSP